MNADPRELPELRRLRLVAQARSEIAHERHAAVLRALLALTAEIATLRAELRAPLKSQPTEGTQT